MRLRSVADYQTARVNRCTARVAHTAADAGIVALDLSTVGSLPGAILNGAGAVSHLATAYDRVQMVRREAFAGMIPGADFDAAKNYATEAFGDGVSTAGYAVLATGGSPVVGTCLVTVGVLTSLVSSIRNTQLELPK